MKSWQITVFFAAAVALFGLFACSSTQNLGTDDAHAGGSGGHGNGGSSTSNGGDGSGLASGGSSGDHSSGGSSGQGGAAGSAGAASGAVLFRWTLAHGQESCLEAGIDTVNVSIGGQSVYLPCSSRDGQSGVVTGIPAGEQGYSIDALTNAHFGLWQSSRTDQVKVMAMGQTTLDVDLEPEDTGSVTFQWTFDGGKSCAQAGVTDIRVSIDGETLGFPCVGKDGEQGTVIGLPAGSPNLTIVGLANDKIIAKAGGQVLVTKTNVDYPVDLPLVDATNTGSVSLSWNLPTGACNTYQRPTVFVQAGNFAPLNLPCLSFSTPGWAGAVLDLLPPGDVAISLNKGTESEANVTAHVVAGKQVTASASFRTGTLDIDTFEYASIAFGITFGGKTCAEVGVSQIHYSAPGFLDPIDGQTPCGDFKLPYSIPHGTFDYQLSATGKGGVAFAAQGTFTAYNSGASFVYVDLQKQPAASGPGSVAFDFAWGNAAVDCGTAGIDRVHLYLSDHADKLVPGTELTVQCADFPAMLTNIAPGTYNVNAEAFTGSAQSYACELRNITVAPGVLSQYVVHSFQGIY